MDKLVIPDQSLLEVFDCLPFLTMEALGELSKSLMQEIKWPYPNFFRQINKYDHSTLSMAFLCQVRWLPLVPHRIKENE